MTDAYQIVTDRIIADLQKGIIPWQKPWIAPANGNGDRSGNAYSRSTGKPYSLLNQMLLGKSGEWATFSQITEAGGKVKKGEKSSICVFWKVLEHTEADKETGEEVIRKSFVLRYYNVFHIESQCEGIEPKYKTVTDTTVYAPNDLENTLQAYYNREHISCRCEQSNKAFYSPSLDYIVIPERNQFADESEYFSTKAHETVHSTGHKSRLDRFSGNGSVAFGSESYSKEELVAEVGASMLLNMFGIETRNSFSNSVAYIQSWIKRLQNDTHFIVSASSKAEKAVNLILGKTSEEPAEA